MQRFERQTDLSFEELTLLLDQNRAAGQPRCLLLNELGIIMLSDDPNATNAETILRGLLDAQSPEDRFICFGYLSQHGASEPETRSACAAFVADPRNAEIVAMMQRQALNPSAN